MLMFRKSTRPLQEELNLPVERIKFQKELAVLLPDPLYILYSQIKAFIEACGNSCIKFVFFLDRYDKYYFNPQIHHCKFLSKVEWKMPLILGQRTKRV